MHVQHQRMQNPVLFLDSHATIRRAALGAAELGLSAADIPHRRYHLYWGFVDVGISHLAR